MSRGTPEEIQLSAGFMQRVELGYLRLISNVERVLLYCGIAAAVGLVVSAGLFAYFGSDFWTSFNEVAAVVAVLGILLALPALSLAVRTEAGVELIAGEVARLRREEQPKEVEQKVVDVEPQQGLDSAFLMPIAEKSAELQALDAAIANDALGSGKLAVVREFLAKAKVYALGQPAGEVSGSGQGTESDLLHFTVEIDGEDRVMLPVFTQSDLMKESIERNPDWASLSVLELRGGDLLQARDPDVTLIINPWSPLEFQIPPEVQ